MKIPRSKHGRCEQRTLESLERDYLQFQSQGKGDIPRANEHFNVIGKVFFYVPINQVREIYRYKAIAILAGPTNTNHIHSIK